MSDLNLDRIRADTKDVKGRRVVTDHILPTLSRLIVEDVPAMADELEQLRAVDQRVQDLVARLRAKDEIESDEIADMIQRAERDAEETR